MGCVGVVIRQLGRDMVMAGIQHVVDIRSAENIGSGRVW